MILAYLEKVILVALVVVSSVFAAKTGELKNALFVEGLGAGVIYSVNYERAIIKDVVVRGGVSYYSWTTGSGDELFQNVNLYTFLLPVMVSYIGLHKDSHYAEFGTGATIVTMAGGHGLGLFSMADNIPSTFALGNIVAGYRFQPAQEGIQFRGGFQGFFAPGLANSNARQMGFVPSLYTSIGYVF